MLWRFTKAMLARDDEEIEHNFQLNDFRKASGESFVFALNGLQKDCGCSKPSS